jgi:predicted acylesterase/phospholipase RssA
MSGGGSNGSWEAGVLWGLANSGHPEDFYYDVVTGVSAGAINTAGISGFTPEDVINAAQFLSDTWNTLSNDQIWSYQPDIPPVVGADIDWELAVRGFFEYNGVVNDAPALETIGLILQGFPEGYKRSIVLAAADVETGEYV